MSIVSDDTFREEPQAEDYIGHALAALAELGPATEREIAQALGDSMRDYLLEAGILGGALELLAKQGRAVEYNGRWSQVFPLPAGHCDCLHVR